MQEYRQLRMLLFQSSIGGDKKDLEGGRLAPD